MKRKITQLTIIIILIIIYSYTLAIEAIPNNIIIFEGETIKVNNYLGFKINPSDETIETSASSSQTINNVGKTTIGKELAKKLIVNFMILMMK